MPRAPKKPTRKAAAPRRTPKPPTRQPIDHSDDPDMPESMAPRRASAIDAALQSGSRIGRITGPNGEGYDPSRDVEEYGTTIDFATAKGAREAGVPVNRYPGKCLHCSKSIGPGKGEIVPTEHVPETKRRGGSRQAVMVQCTGASCLTKGGKVRGGAVRTTDAAQGTKVTKTKIGKAGGGRHRVEQTHEGNTSSMEWHPRSGVFEFDIHPAHVGIGMEDRLHRDATGTAAREGYTQPRPLKGN
jgi:hypothetical protein